MGALAQ